MSGDPRAVEHAASRDLTCPACGYNLRNIQRPTCPECGVAIGLRLVRSDRPDESVLPCAVIMWWGLAMSAIQLGSRGLLWWTMFQPVRQMAVDLGQPPPDFFGMVWASLDWSHSVFLTWSIFLALAAILGLVALKKPAPPWLAPRRVATVILVGEAAALAACFFG